MNESRIKCITCESKILQSTSERNRGLCGVCKREVEHLAHNKEIGRFEDAWKALIQYTKMTDVNNNDGKQRIISIVEKFVDKNLIEQLNKPDIKDNYFFLNLPDNYKEKLTGEYDRNSESDAYDLMNCTALPENWQCPDVKFECKLKQLPLVPVLAAPFIILHKTIVKKISDLTANSAQYLPVKVIAKNGTSEDFLAVNILSEHEVWDLNVSTWKGASWDESSPSSMRNMMTKRNLSIEGHIFRNKDFSPLIVVSKELGSVLAGESSDSLLLQSTNKWHN